jgi:hypothetical protein
MNREQMIDFLNKIDPRWMDLLVIRSYNRPRYFMLPLILQFTPEMLEKVRVVVREEQVGMYREVAPQLQYWTIPPNTVTSLGTTSQWIRDKALAEGFTTIIESDDDICQLNVCYETVDGQGRAVSRRLRKVEKASVANFPLKVLALASYASSEAFRASDTIVQTGMTFDTMVMDPYNSRTMWEVGHGQIARQCVWLRLDRLAQHGVRQAPEFDRYGEDIGFAANVFQHGLWQAKLPSILYRDQGPIGDSTLHDASNTQILRDQEWADLQRYTVAPYLAPRYDEDGNYVWSNINWRKFHKENKTSATTREWIL